MLVNSNELTQYILGKLDTTETAVRQQLHRAGLHGALVRNTVVNNTLVNVYELDLVIEYFEFLMSKKGLNNRLQKKFLNLWEDYIQVLEDFRYDFYRCT